MTPHYRGSRRWGFSRKWREKTWHRGGPLLVRFAASREHDMMSLQFTIQSDSDLRGTKGTTSKGMLKMTKRIKIVAVVILLVVFLGLALMMFGKQSEPPLVNTSVVAEPQLKKPEGSPRDVPVSSPREVVIYASDLPKSALSEFEFWNEAASPGGRMVGTPQTGGNLDPPPENDPHVAFKVEVQQGVPYRCWIHMKVGAPKGVSQANKLWVQFTGAVDKANQEVFKPGTGSYLTAQGPTSQGWTWVGCGESPISFRTSPVTVRLQAGMEGVGFDQFLLSPARFLDKPPSEAVVTK